MKRWTFILVVSLAVSSILCSQASQAGIVVTISEVGSDVVFDALGSIDTTTLTEGAGGGVGGGIGFANFGVGSPLLEPASVFSHPNSSGPLIIAPQSVIILEPTSGSGTPFSIDTNFGVPVLFLPQTYSSGDSIVAQSIYANETLSSLGFTPGQTFLWTFGPESVSATVTAIPEPNCCVAAIVASSLLVLWRKRSKDRKLERKT